MTIVIGVLCSDGAVVASDSAATFGTVSGQQTIGQQPSRKVQVLDGSVVFATSGAVGLSQSLCSAVLALHRSKGIPSDPIQAKDQLQVALRNAMMPGFQAAHAARAAGMPPAVTENVGCATILALPVMGIARLYSFDLAGQGEAATESLPCVSIGSGQQIADPFLAHLRRVFWPGRLPSVSEGVFAAVWTVKHVIATNPGGVAGEVQIASIEKDKRGFVARLHDQKGVDEHHQNIQAAEEHLAAFSLTQTAVAPGDEDLPKPPTC